MDVLLENVPHLVPSEEKVKGWFGLDEGEPDLWEDDGGRGMLLGSWCCLCWVLEGGADVHERAGDPPEGLQRSRPNTHVFFGQYLYIASTRALTRARGTGG